MQFNFLKMVLGLIVIFSFSVSANEVTRDDIFRLAESFVGQTDPTGEKQEELEALIEEFMLDKPILSMQERAMKVIGTWNQVWGPYAFDGSEDVPRGMDVTKIYQYISPNGYYYNFGEYRFFGIRSRTFLRGNYEIGQDEIKVRFNKTGLLLKEMNYALAGEAIEKKEVRTVYFPESFPPVGIGGTSVEVYSDDEIRINYGTIDDSDAGPALFIMRRVR